MPRWSLPTLVFSLPVKGAPGAFGSQRSMTYHTGVDIYTRLHDPVFAVEDSEVVSIGPFTGTSAGSPWYRETGFLMASGPTGVVCYGEITPAKGLVPGMEIKAGDRVGYVEAVLNADKGNGTTMLHLELYKHETVEPLDWPIGEPMPSNLLDPTPHLQLALDRYTKPPSIVDNEVLSYKRQIFLLELLVSINKNRYIR